MLIVCCCERHSLLTMIIEATLAFHDSQRSTPMLLISSNYDMICQMWRTQVGLLRELQMNTQICGQMITSIKKSNKWNHDDSFH